MTWSGGGDEGDEGGGEAKTRIHVRTRGKLNQVYYCGGWIISVFRRNLDYPTTKMGARWDETPR